MIILIKLIRTNHQSDQSNDRHYFCSGQITRALRFICFLFAFTLTRKNFMPISKAMILLTSNGVASLNLNSFNSSMNLFRTHWNLQSKKSRKLRQTDMNTRRKSHQAITGLSSPQSCWLMTPIRYLDCARTPLTSAKRSETIWKLRLLGPTSALKAARKTKKIQGNVCLWKEWKQWKEWREWKWTLCQNAILKTALTDPGIWNA